MEGSQSAVLHTGDSVQSPDFSMIYVATAYYNLTLLLQKRLEAPCLVNVTSSTYQGNRLSKILDAIYLDNARLISTY